MSRRASDPRVRELMAIFEETIALSDASHARRGTHRRDFSEGSVDYFVHHVATCADETFDDWPDEALRAVVLAFARHAPPEAFTRMIKRAREAIATDRKYAISDRAEVDAEEQLASGTAN